jgi:hypothetical protein
MTTIQNTFTDKRVYFSYYNYNKGIFFDEKKKRFVDFQDMDQVTYKNYNRPFVMVSLFHILTYSTVQIILELAVTFMTRRLSPWQVYF